MSELKTNKVSPATGTGLQLGDSGDTVTVPTGATLTVTDGIAATSIADGSVTNAEFQYINTLSSNAQTQLDGKSPTAGNASLVTTGTVSSGVWNGTAVADGYIASASTWNGMLPKAGGTMTGTLVMGDQVVQKPEIKDYSETKTALSAAASVTIDIEDGNVFTITPDQNTTFVFSNPSPTGKSCAFTLVWTQDSSDRTIAWPGSVDWAGGSAPDVTSGSGKIDIYTFFTMDAGTIWYGFQAGADMG